MSIYISMQSMYAFYSALIAALIAQLLKPLFVYPKLKRWDWSMMHASGGFPSSHSALVSAIALSIGINEKFSSTNFAITLALAVIVIYDAANVRYYSGQNIKVTQQLLRDLRKLHPDQFESEIYETKLKPVLGHRWIEVMGGIFLGCAVALLFKLIVS